MMGFFGKKKRQLSLVSKPSATPTTHAENGTNGAIANSRRPSVKSVRFAAGRGQGIMRTSPSEAYLKQWAIWLTTAVFEELVL